MAVACATTTIDEYETCALDLAAPDGVELAGAPGDTVQVVGGPLTELRDTRVDVAGVAAEAVEIERSPECADCESCREDAGCAPCGLCAGLPLDRARRAQCFGDPLADPPVTGSCDLCTESLSFVVPTVPPGWTSLLVLNRNGQSEAIPFLVLPGAGGTGETGAPDTSSDTAAPDTAAPDTAAADTGAGDTGAGDTGAGDTAGDTGAGDTGTADTGTGDTGSDTGSGDTATSDTGVR